MDDELIVSGGDVLPDPTDIVENSNSFTLYADRVVVVSDTGVEPAAYETGSGYQLPEYYVNYFSGVLANMEETEYLAFCIREYNTGSYNSYTDNYYLVYDLVVEDEIVVNGTYPCLHIYRNSSNNSYYDVRDTTYTLTSYPSFSYGSIEGTSDLRKGVTHNETLTTLLFLGVFTVLYLLGCIFKHIPKFTRRGK